MELQNVFNYTIYKMYTEPHLEKNDLQGVHPSLTQTEILYKLELEISDLGSKGITLSV